MTAILGVVEFQTPVYKDGRGLFTSPLREPDFEAAVGRKMFPVKDISYNVSGRGVLRGIHYTTTPPGRAKFVYCPHGVVTDYLVDLRVGSPTFGTWSVTELSGDCGRALYIPIGVGHAFLSHREGSVIVYVMSQGYVPEHELAISAVDPAVGLPIGDMPITQSQRDVTAPTLKVARQQGLLPDYETCLKVEAALWA